MRRGDIYLVDFGKSKESFAFGKKRPALIVQTNKLNLALEEGLYDYLLVVPLSTKEDIITEDFRYKINPVQDLEQESFVVCNSICFLHKRYFTQKLATLSDTDMKNISKMMRDVMEL